MSSKNDLIKDKKYHSKAIMAGILINYNFLINFCTVCLINNDNYFDYDKLLDFIYYCKCHNKYTSLISKIYYSRFKRATELLIQNHIVEAFPDKDNSSLTLFINKKLTLNSIYANKAIYEEMQAFITDYNKFIYGILNENHNKILTK